MLIDTEPGSVPDLRRQRRALPHPRRQRPGAAGLAQRARRPHRDRHLPRSDEPARRRQLRADAAARRDQPTTVAADRVVLALPFTLLRDVRLDVELPPVKRKAIDELGYGTNAKLMVGFSERALAHGGPARTAACSPTCRSSSPGRRRRLQPGSAGILVDFTGGRHGVEIGERHRRPSRPSEFVARLERDLPGHRRARASARCASTGRRFAWTQGQLRLLPARPVDGDLRRRGGAGRQPPLRRRAHLDRLPGLHGGRCRDRRSRRPDAAGGARRRRAAQANRLTCAGLSGWVGSRR